METYKKTIKRLKKEKYDIKQYTEDQESEYTNDFISKMEEHNRGLNKAIKILKKLKRKEKKIILNSNKQYMLGWYVDEE